VIGVLPRLLGGEYFKRGEEEVRGVGMVTLYLARVPRMNQRPQWFWAWEGAAKGYMEAHQKDDFVTREAVWAFIEGRTAS